MVNVKELIYLSKAISDSLYGTMVDKDAIEVVFKLPEDEIQDINEQFFYGNNPYPSKEKVRKADEVIAKIGDINFKFIKNEKSSSSVSS